MRIKITKSYFIEMDRDWYDPSILSGKGTMDEQILEYELDRLKQDQPYAMEGVIPDTLKVEIVEEETTDLSEQQTSETSSVLPSETPGIH